MKTPNKKEWPVAVKSIVLAMAGAGLVSLPYLAYANPTGGQVVAGNVTIRQESASKVGITQTTAKGIIDWQKYSIGANEQVQYYQPSASSVTLNRVVGQDPSKILGRLTANGRIFLVNPNGIYFGKNAQVDVAGLVASTHNIHNEDFLAGKYNFNIPGNPGAAVINEGTIRIADTGVAAFVAPSVVNRGVIVARLGKVAMAAANGFTLDFHGDQLLSFLVTDDVAKTAFDIDGKQLTSFVENSGRIEAQGGYVLLTAKAAESAIHGVINQSGVIEATTVGLNKGEIILNAGKGSLEVSGTLDASAPNGGDGGFIETSGAKVAIANTTKVSTFAANGNIGTWLIDPADFIIAASGGDISGATLSTNLQTNNIELQSVSGGASGNGDLFVNDAVNWSANTRLVLDAERNVNINAAITGTGNSAGVSLNPIRGDYYLNSGGKITLPGANSTFSVKGTQYILIHDVNQLQAMNNGLSSRYALGNDIDATATRGWNSGAGFQPIGQLANTYTGTFDGLGHVISNLYINRPNEREVGFIGSMTNSIVRNTGLENIDITAGDIVGGIAGTLRWGSSLQNTYATGTVTAVQSGVFEGHPTTATGAGGLVGFATPYYYGGRTWCGSCINIDTSYANVNVTGNTQLGGVVGIVDQTNIRNTYALGNVTSTNTVSSAAGGLVGYLFSSNVTNSYSVGLVQGGASYVGGLIGWRNRTISNTNYWDTQTSQQSNSFGGTGKTTAQMQQQATFVGWDFINTWRIVEGSSYPLLRSLTQGTIIVTPNQLGIRANNVTKIYDGVAVTKITESVNDHIANDLASLAGWNGGVTTTGLLGADLLTNASIFSGMLTYGGTWQGAKNSGIYSIIPSGLSSQKYEIVYAPGQLSIQPRPVDIAVSKTYNGNGTFTSGFEVTNGVVAGDATPTISGSATVASGNAGTYNEFSTNTLVSNDRNYTANPQYVYSGELGKVTAQIVPATLSLLGVTGRREYDGTDNANWNDNTQLRGLLDKDIGRVALISGSGTLSGKDVGQRQLVSLGNLILDGDAAGNYALTTIGSRWVIVPRALFLQATSDAKSFDGNNTSSKLPTVIGLVDGELISGLGQHFESQKILGYNNSTLHPFLSEIISGYTTTGSSNYIIKYEAAKGTIAPLTDYDLNIRMYQGFDNYKPQNFGRTDRSALGYIFDSTFGELNKGAQILNDSVLDTKIAAGVSKIGDVVEGVNKLVKTKDIVSLTSDGDIVKTVFSTKLINSQALGRADKILGATGKGLQLAGSAVLLSNILVNARNGELSDGDAVDLVVNVVGYSPIKLLTSPFELASLAASFTGSSISSTLSSDLEIANKYFTSYFDSMENIARSIADDSISLAEAELKFNRERSSYLDLLNSMRDSYRDWAVVLTLGMTGNASATTKTVNAIDKTVGSISSLDFEGIKHIAAGKVLSSGFEQ